MSRTETGARPPATEMGAVQRTVFALVAVATTTWAPNWQCMASGMTSEEVSSTTVPPFFGPRPGLICVSTGKSTRSSRFCRKLRSIQDLSLRLSVPIESVTVMEIVSPPLNEGLRKYRSPCRASVTLLEAPDSVIFCLKCWSASAGLSSTLLPTVDDGARPRALVGLSTVIVTVITSVGTLSVSMNDMPDNMISWYSGAIILGASFTATTWMGTVPRTVLSGTGNPSSMSTTTRLKNSPCCNELKLLDGRYSTVCNARLTSSSAPTKRMAGSDVPLPRKKFRRSVVLSVTVPLSTKMATSKA